MRVRRWIVATFALGGAVAVAAPNALAGSDQIPGNVQTHPTVRPRVGRRHSTFRLTFTLAQAPGRTGLLDIYYREVVSPPADTGVACSPAQPAPVFSGSEGSAIKVALRAPAPGWCRGRYAVTVYLERTTGCGPPIAVAAHIVCPVSADVEPAFRVGGLDTGETHFTVR